MWYSMLCGKSKLTHKVKKKKLVTYQVKNVFLKTR